ncbi:S24 family peptidase [Rhizorhabdus dicambivorans]|uniref:Peptidase S24 n=1 Tax=Rhizorhabdus dicambivorans TaxID=1850238 RepID=A0A2A4G245_9SPHN|nr:S24 family peptidase [Rhizorhabdus dicambivorans]ATE64821.1 peptidase S24 [Rhizorhabdus dicambivorans]PCE44096.1 peptidase S24 [Rhizorhabdus dicambivorans]
MADDVRTALDALIRERGEDYSAVSRLLGRNPAYIQQFIKRGTPRRLSEEDRLRLAAYFRVSEDRLGGRAGAGTPPDMSALVAVPRIDIGASAGAGGLAEIEERGRPIGFDEKWLRDLGARRTDSLSIISVAGDSMEPTLCDGDDILVDREAVAVRAGAIHVLRLDGMLMVKRIIRDGGRLLIRSDNPAYPDIADYDPALLAIIGRVLWCGRKL